MMVRTLLLLLVLALASSGAYAQRDRYVEGPRQKAVVLGEPLSVGLPISISPSPPEMQALFDQGVAQVFGGSFFEAERSFQTILIEDPDCPMAYWGLAQANVQYPVRAKWFGRAAWLKRGLAGLRERRLIDSLARYYGVFGADEPEGMVEPWNPAPGEEPRPVLLAAGQVLPSPERANALAADYRAILEKNPEDTLARALLVGHVLATGRGPDSRDAIEAQLEGIFKRSPEYPAHAFALQFWATGEDPERGAASAERYFTSPYWNAHLAVAATQALAAAGRSADAQRAEKRGRDQVDRQSRRHWKAPDWALEDAYGRTFKLEDYRGKPLLIVNFLGLGCVHCMEQLQAIRPLAEKFKARGIEIVAIGLQSPEELRVSMGDDPTKSGYPFPILCDPDFTQFKAYQSFDDFADAALHGTYLLNGEGKVRWHDISHLPYMEIQRLLEMSRGSFRPTSK